MRIGILTFWWSKDNYGQLLQCYALQKFLRNAGHDAFLIRYRPGISKNCILKKFYKAFNIVKLFRFLLSRKKAHDIQKENDCHSRQFDLFFKQNIYCTAPAFYSTDDLRKNLPEADLYICGSDKIWNLSSDAVKHSAFTLGFLPEWKKRISYAASFGQSDISKSCKEAFAPFLRKFNLVTVRENSGIDICRDMGVDADVVCDPALLLDKTAYERLFDKSSIMEHPYVFVYLLTNPCDISVRKLKEWACKNDLDFIYVTGNYGWMKCDYDDKGIERSYLTIQQWLYHLANAEYVVTNSFHCSLFSLLFERKVGVVPLHGSLSNTNTRIDSLFENLLCLKTEIKNNDFDILKAVSSKSIDDGFIRKSKSVLLHFIGSIL